MEWGRIKTADGQVLTGVIADGLLHPRAALGSEDEVGPAVSLEGAMMLPPCVPGKFIGLWNNFHAATAQNNLTPPAHPLFFLKPLSSLAGPGSTVALPPDIGRVIYEGELGVVIGETCKNVSVDAAQNAILGYTCVNDITALEVLTADPSFPQWTRAKGFDGFGVIGPVVQTDVDWQGLTIRTLVNDRERQSYPASDMIMPPAEIISHLSRDMTLNAGDVIACGTSIGARPIRAGQNVTVSIEGIGDLSITVAAPD